MPRFRVLGNPAPLARAVDGDGAGATHDLFLEAIRRHVFAAGRLQTDNTTVPLLAKLKTVPAAQ